MSYIPPDSINIVFDFTDGEYSPPNATNIVFNFGESVNNTQYISAVGFDLNIFGSVVFESEAITVSPVGFTATAFGAQKVIPSQIIKAGGLSSFVFGISNVWNFDKAVYLNGFNTLSFSTLAKIYNLKQFANLNNSGINSATYGVAYVQGGVKEIRGSGINSAAIPQPKVINTRADQYVDLRSPSRGIAPPIIDLPNVSPRIIYPKGILPGAFGTAWVQRNPSPKGFTTDLYGTAWVSHSPRYLTPAKVDAFQPGYPKIFDPTQRIYHAGSPHIPGGIFGDIAIRNSRRLISVPGFDQSLYGDWSNLYSNLTRIGVQSFDMSLFGNNVIWNKTPSVIPGTWNSNSFGQTLIADRIRRINARGFGFSETERFGKHVLSKPPEIKPSDLSSMDFGQAFVSNKVREVFAGANDHLRISSDLTVWFRYRHIQSVGIYSQAISTPKIEHGIRNLLVKGSDFGALGRPTAWFKVRSISVSGIYEDFASNHRIGGTQFVRPAGFIASKFGERIVPENQGIYGTGFNAQGFSENHQIELYKRWVRPQGFLTFGQQASDRYGTPKVWNKRQYIQHQYDSGDGLNPPPFGQWTSIANRNRQIKVSGFDALRHGYTYIDNKARPLLPKSLDTMIFGSSMVSHRIRHLKLEGMEAPYISSWGRVHNTAFVIAPLSGKHDQWGAPSVVNTRREYRWIGAFESMAFGQPMIAFAIRNISMESRYSIYQPSMPLPKVDLYTRYIEPIGPELQAFGGPSLHVKWNTFTPRWTHREFFGEPVVRNRTPELRQRGNISEEFGNPSLRLQWRFLPVEGYGSELWGKTGIAFRDRSVKVNGNNYMTIGLHRVIKTGAPPYSLQTISLDWASEGPRPDNYEGEGIKPPKEQVSTPSFKTNVIFAEGFVATKFGAHHAQSNGIIIDSGIQEFTIGNHTVGLKNRTIQVPTMGDLLQMEETRPRLSPHTIYAVMDAPAQAIKNHTQLRLHYVNSDSGDRPPGEVFGHVTVTNRHRKIMGSGFNVIGQVPNPQIDLRKRYIRPQSFNSFRMGWHSCLDGAPQTIEQYDSIVMSQYGNPTVTALYYGPRMIRIGGINASAFGGSSVEFFHRSLSASGFLATQMGSGRSGDTPYKPQGLWVGEPKPTIPQGFNAEVFGSTSISLRVRDVSVIGFNSFISEMDISNFKGRMKVELVKKPVVIEPKEVFTQSFVNTSYGVPDIRLKTHYIRPDGNSDQYRKGGPT